MIVTPIDPNKEIGTISPLETLCVEVHGKIGRSTGLGMYVCGVLHCGEYFGIGGIYRQSHRYGAIMRQRMNSYAPSNPKTQKQQAWRAGHRQALKAWRDLSDEQKHELDVRADKIGMTGNNLFISRVLNKLRADLIDNPL